MTETLLDFMIGPFRVISDFYFENQLILNTIVIGFALFQVIFKKKKTQDKSAS
ncbi:hypothetical protein [Virgibacillus profundi]|uniref:hypothetical protein n=1 Tax=Virgibacillus profundi TaxID=2024555 RepID=UPI0013FE0716|nr:hypothetical protein [Virgibacillus profundi]